MSLLSRPLTLEEAAAVQLAALAVLKAYDVALVDPQTKCPSVLHAALLMLRRSLEGK